MWNTEAHVHAYKKPTTFGLKVRNRAGQQTTSADNSQRNQRKAHAVFCPFPLTLYTVHGQLHGQFQSERLRVSMKPRCLITLRMGVFFNRTLSRFSSNLAGTARSTRSARERATATSEPRAPRIVKSILVSALTPAKTPKFGGLNPPKHRQAQTPSIRMQAQPFLHSQLHPSGPPAEQLAIVHLRKWSLRIVPGLSIFHCPTISLLPNNQDQYGGDLRRSFGSSTHEKLNGIASTSANSPMCVCKSLSARGFRGLSVSLSARKHSHSLTRAQKMKECQKGTVGTGRGLGAR